MKLAVAVGTVMLIVGLLIGGLAGLYLLRPSEVQVKGAVNLFTDDKCCVVPAHVVFFYYKCQPFQYYLCQSSFNATITNEGGLEYAYSVTVPNGHQYIINPVVDFHNGTVVACSAGSIPVYSYSPTLNYSISCSC